MMQSLCSARDALRSGGVSSVELTQAHLQAIERLNPAMNAFITVTGEQAMGQAREADRLRAAGEDAPLLGLPIAN